MIELGDRVKDKVTGLTGIVVGRTDWLHQCRQFTVQAERLQDGKPVIHWFDEGGLVVVQAGVHKLTGPTDVPEGQTTGGPERPLPERQTVSSRYGGDPT
jgi:hypothetical protein